MGGRKDPIRSATKEKILSLIRENPGISSREISDRLNVPSHILSAYTCELRDRKNLIVNRGKKSLSFRWYPVTEETKNAVPYIHDAREFIKGFYETPVAHREEYVAGYLQDLLEGE